MAIVFESPKDPYGIQQLGSTLGNALMVRGQEEKKLATQKKETEQANKSQSEFFKWIQKLPAGEDPFKHIQSLGTNIEAAGGDVRYIQPFLQDMYKQNVKSQLETRAFGDEMKALGLNPPESPLTKDDLSQGSQNSIQDLPDERLVLMRASKNKTIKSLATAEMDRRGQDIAKNVANQKEQVEIRKETRKKIAEFSQPYENIPELKANVHRMQEAKKLIESGKVSLDQNWLRNISEAFLESKGLDIPAALLKTPEQQKLWSLLRPALQAKEIGGANPSTKEVLLALSSLASEFKGQDANLFIIENLLNKSLLAERTGQEIYKMGDTNNLTFQDFQNKLNEQLSPYQEKLENNVTNLSKIQAAKSIVKNKTPVSGYIFMMDENGKPQQVLKEQQKGAEEQQWIPL